MRAVRTIHRYTETGRRGALAKILRHYPSLKLPYLKFAKFLATRGISPPAASSTNQAGNRWREQGATNSFVVPETYIQCDDSVEKLFEEVLPLLSSDSQILEIGCNAGRNLDYLFHKGFQDLTGIEIGHRAVELFAEVFPDTYKNSNIIVGDAAQEIQGLEAKSFDLVFTNAVLVNIPARDNRIFREICRVCRGYILTLENEGSWTVFPRDFQKMFEKNGFAMVSYRWLVWNDDNTCLVFPHPVRDKHILQNNIIRLFTPKEGRRAKA